VTLTTGFALAISVLTLGTAPSLATDVAHTPPGPHASRISGKTLNERLIDAAREGHLDEVEALIHAGAKVDARDDSLRTPLILAASTGQVEIVKALLKAGADVNAQEGVNGETALMCAARDGNLPLVRILLDAKAQAIDREPAAQAAVKVGPSPDRTAAEAYAAQGVHT
jgi:ankyrin repeat protein